MWWVSTEQGHSTYSVALNIGTGEQAHSAREAPEDAACARFGGPVVSRVRPGEKRQQDATEGAQVDVVEFWVSSGLSMARTRARCVPERVYAKTLT